MRLKFSPAAETDLMDIASFIARDNVPRTISFVDDLQAACGTLLDFSQSGRRVTTFAPDCDLSRMEAM